MTDTSVHEFVSRIFNDRAFLQEVMNNCWEIGFEGDDAMGRTFAVAAQKMGYSFTSEEIDAEAKTQLKTLGIIKIIGFLNALSKAQKKAKKAASR